jgi:phosphatidate cytidylyltransferase
MRIVTAGLLLAGLLGALFFLPQVGWTLLCSLICAAAAWEWGGLAGWPGQAKFAYAAVLGALCFVLMPPYGGESGEFGRSFAAALIFLASAFWLLLVPFWLKYKWRLRAWSAVLTGGIVLLPPLLVFTAFRQFEPVVALMAAAPVWIADIAAYFSGRAFGRAKLAPDISPGKTWAGAFGAALGVTIYCGTVVYVWESSGGFISTHSEHGALAVAVAIPALGIGLTALSIIGDLFESLLKRQAGVKDSGSLLPGHGGILDRIDSLTSTLPVMMMILFFLVFG